jgi:hypothetical protein
VRRIVIAGAAVIGVGVLALVLWTVHSTWNRLDAAADNYEPPRGFEVVAQVRQGTARCFVTCDEGGGAIVTIVMTVEDPAQGTCDRVKESVDAVSTSASVETDVPGFECVWKGDLDGDAFVDGVVMRREELTPLGPAGVYGPRWTEKIDIPDATLLAWVTFDSGLA